MEGHWVIGIDEEGAAFLGYIIADYKTVSLVKVTRSENKKAIGKEFVIEHKYFRVLSHWDTDLHIKDIDALINLAIDTNDREWFIQLSEIKREMEKLSWLYEYLKM